MILRGKFFKHSEYLNTVHVCFLELLEDRIHKGASPRAIAKIVASLKTPAYHERIMEMTIEKMHASGRELTGVEALRAYGDPVAEFP